MSEFSLDLLVETLPSKITQKNYKCILKLFLEFGKFSSYDKITQTDVKVLEKIVKAYIISLKSTMNPNSIPSYSDAIKSFLEANDIVEFLFKIPHQTHHCKYNYVFFVRP